MSVSTPQMPKMALKRKILSTVKANRLVRAKKVTSIVPLGKHTHARMYACTYTHTWEQEF